MNISPIVLGDTVIFIPWFGQLSLKNFLSILSKEFPLFLSWISLLPSKLSIGINSFLWSNNHSFISFERTVPLVVVVNVIFKSENLNLIHSTNDLIFSKAKKGSPPWKFITNRLKPVELSLISYSSCVINLSRYIDGAFLFVS